MLCLFSFKWSCPLALVCLAVPVQHTVAVPTSVDAVSVCVPVWDYSMRTVPVGPTLPWSSPAALQRDVLALLL